MNPERKIVLWACFLIIALSSFSLAMAQTTQYSRQTFTPSQYDDIKLVADISGNHHMLSFALGRKTVIHVFDEKLQLMSEKEFDYKFSREASISTISFNNYYLLSIHQPDRSEYQVWRIDASGDAVDFSERFQQLVERCFKKGVGSLQIVNSDNKLFILSHMRNSQSEKMLSTVVQVNPDFTPLSTREVVIPLKRNETPKEVTLLGESLFMLKTSFDTNGRYQIQVLKSNLDDGKLVMNHFISDAAHSKMSLMYNAEDTSLLIYSWVQNKIFISKLDTSLNLKAPVVLITNQFLDNAIASFLFLPGKVQQCITLYKRGTDFRMTGNSSGAANPYFGERSSNYREGYQPTRESFDQYRSRLLDGDDYTRGSSHLSGFLWW